MQVTKDDKDISSAAEKGFSYRESLKKPDGTFLNKTIKVERYLNRPLASLIVRLVYHSRVTPNGLTFFSFFLGLLGAFFLSRSRALLIEAP